MFPRSEGVRRFWRSWTRLRRSTTRAERRHRRGSTPCVWRCEGMEFWPELESEEDRWTAFREAIRWRVRTAGSVTKALGASNLSDACKSVNELSLPLAERFPEWEEIESLRQFLLQQVA